MIECKICEKQFKNLQALGTHIGRKHKLSMRKYYDDFLKKENEGICFREGCKNPTFFYSLSVGYLKTCSEFCCNKMPEKLDKIRDTLKKQRSAPKYKIKYKKQMKELWADPLFRKNRIAGAKKQWEDLKFREMMSGENCHLWNGGSSFEPYSFDFNNNLKKEIRGRDNYTCQLCEKTEEDLKRKLCIHHVDYDKKNSLKNNLVSLCVNCHSQVNFSRIYWETYFKNKVSPLIEVK